MRSLIRHLRRAWRSLTAMRTALVLLFLLALAAVPGALLPQRELNQQKTDQYIADRGTLGEWMDRLQLFDVFSSAWFTAIYVLLFVSLVGCLTPRLFELARNLRAKPVPVPRNLSRLPHHAEHTLLDEEPHAVAARIDERLRGWRRRTVMGDSRDATPGVIEISAERGYVRECGNLVFHFALLALLVSMALGRLYSYEGTRSLVADGQQGLCNTSTAVYDSFRAGNLVDGTDLNQFCIKVETFRADFLPTGQPAMYESQVLHSKNLASPPSTWERTTVRVNEPLRLAGDRVYVLGNGFAPRFTVTFPNGERRTQTAIFIPDNLQTMQSSGAVRFDTPAGMFPDEDQRRSNQIALEGIFAPTAAFDGSLLTSSFPTPQNPYVAIRIYRGDTGLDTGRPQSAYTLDRAMIDQGRLQQQAQANLAAGQSHRIPDGTTVSFDGFQRWVSVQVSHDPAQVWVGASSVVMLLGLVLSMVIRRRRIWVRLSPLNGGQGTHVQIGGLARTDRAGWGERFDEHAIALLTASDRQRVRL